VSDDLRQIWQQAKAFALSRKVKPELAEEFAQEFVLDSALEPEKPFNLDWKLTDFLRKECGDTRSAAGRLRAGQTSLDAPIGDTGQLLAETIAAPQSLPENPIHAALERAHLTGIEERVYVDHAEDGVEQDEIAVMLGVHFSRVCQIFAVAKRKIRDAAVLDEMLDEYMRDPQASKLEVAWL